MEEMGGAGWEMGTASGGDGLAICGLGHCGRLRVRTTSGGDGLALCGPCQPTWGSPPRPLQRLATQCCSPGNEALGACSSQGIGSNGIVQVSLGGITRTMLDWLMAMANGPLAWRPMYIATNGWP